MRAITIVSILGLGCGGRGLSSDASSGEDAAVDPPSQPDVAVPDLADQRNDRIIIDPPATPLGIHLTGVGARLLGFGESACAKADDGHTWCAFTDAGPSLGEQSLWVADVTEALARPAKVGAPRLACDGADPHCFELAQNVEAGPEASYTNGFWEETLVFRQDVSAAGVGTSLGRVSAWRPGWKIPHTLTGPQSFYCVAIRDHAYCVDGYDEASGGFSWVAGRLVDGGSQLLEQDRTEIGDSYPSAALSPDGKHFVWSSMKTSTSPVVSYWKSVDDLGDPAVRTVLLADGFTTEFFPVESDRLFVKSGTSLGGTLSWIPWPPTGQAPTKVADEVFISWPITDPAGLRTLGVASWRNLDLDVFRWDVWLTRDLAAPGYLVAAKTCRASFDQGLSRVVYATSCDDDWNSDLVSRRLDATGAPTGAACTLADGRAGLPSRPITEDGRWAYFLADYDTTVGVGAGKIADLETCKIHDTGDPAVSDAFPLGSDGFIDAAASDGIEGWLRIVDLRKGAPAMPRLAARDAGLTFAVIAEKAGPTLVFTLDKNAAKTDGVWASEGALLP